MVQQSMSMDEVERAELVGVGVEHVGDEERAALTETRSRVLDVLSAHVKPDVFDTDVREVVDEVAGGTFKNVAVTGALSTFRDLLKVRRSLRKSKRD